jgi:phosphoenolpyruvate-protein kinase (PTS system EI component)
MSHTRPDVFRTQLRALMRASPVGRLKILLPMVSSLAEVEFARATLESVKSSSRTRALPSTTTCRSA